MLVLYETALGYCLFKLTDSAKLKSASLWEEFEAPEKANGLLKLKALHRFDSAATAVDEISSIQEGKLGKGLKKFLSDEIIGKNRLKEELVVVDTKLAASITKKLGIKVLADSSTLELYRGIRNQIAALLDGLDPRDLAQMSLGLSHSLSRFKLKFSPDKVDAMIVQSISLLDDLDKEINIYAMRVKEWYGWHFPELGKILTDSIAYAKVVRAVGFRTNAANTSLAHILPEDLEQTVKLAAEISMGTEISESDIANINGACDQVIAISAYRTQLAEYLRNRMNAIAPNLTALVGELVGARLISHAGSLLNLAKHPASTVQILGAEKALFRALKTKHDTPKYGLIYHASLVGQAPPKLKGKMARMVATKAALSIRVDALTDTNGKSEPFAPTLGLENRAKLESRLRALELHGEGVRTISSPTKKYVPKGNVSTYNTAADLVSTQRDPAAAATQAVVSVQKEKEEKQKVKRVKKREEKGKEEEKKKEMEKEMEVEIEKTVEKDKHKERKEKKKKEKAAVEADAKDIDKKGGEKKRKHSDKAAEHEETEKEEKARKKAKKEEKKAQQAAAATVVAVASDSITARSQSPTKAVNGAHEERSDSKKKRRKEKA